MLFNSYIFILAFLPITLLGYYFLNKFSLNKCSLIWLAIMSFVFYGYFNIFYLLILWTSIATNYFVSRLLQKKTTKLRLKKVIMFLGVLFNVGLIFYFKYYDFFIENINNIFYTSFEVKNILLPLGISFFTFQQISYVIDSYKGETKDYTPLEYVVFVSFFPQLIAGPIVLHKEVIPQFRNKDGRCINWENMAQGLCMFSLGLFKKVLIADTFGKAVTYGYDNMAAISSLEAGLTMLSYTIQIYFDFSGYCDMASGVAKMFNIHLPINFDSPYKATSIVEFWNRWHMTLTRFLREYIYFPLGGSKKGKIRTYINILIVFLISGIWHGANWTFILWGGIHGAANVLNRIFKSSWERLHTVTQWLLTFCFINFAWAIFRADNVVQGVKMIWKSINMRDLSLSNKFLAQFQLTEIAWITWIAKRIPGLRMLFLINITGSAMWTMIIIAFFILLNCENCQRRKIFYNWRNVFAMSFLFMWALMSLSGVSTFLYFNF